MGLSRTSVELSEPNKEWKENFEAQREILKKIFREDALDIQHVGSTAIPGLKAKPIIDIAVAVKKLDDVLKYVDKLEKVGYEFRGNAGVEGRYFFAKGAEDNRTHYLHTEPISSPNWESHIFFRDYLIENPKLITEYEKIKIELATKYPDDRKSYTAGKNKFITEVLEKARKKYRDDKTYNI